MAAAFLANFFFWSGLSIGAVVFSALVDITGGQWLGPMGATARQLRWFLPISFVLFIALLWRWHDVYPAASLSVGLRDGIALAAIYTCAFLYSAARRRTGTAEVARATDPHALILLIVYVLGFSLIVADLIMSPDPQWTSTVFPAYVLVGNVFCGAAAVAAIAGWTTMNADASAVSASRVRDIANVLVGMALFWVYLFWSQFLVMWYGNLTREVGFMMARISVSRLSGWIVLVMCVALPPIVLLPRWGKSLMPLRTVALLILVGFWIERWILISPNLPRSTPVQRVTVSTLFALAFGLSALRVGRAGPRDGSV